MIKRVFWMEWKKAFRNKYFYAVLMIGMLFSLMSTLYVYDVKTSSMAVSGNPEQQMMSLYSAWIGAEDMSMGYLLFFTLMPFLAMIPYGWSFCIERNSGYLRNVAIRCHKRTYLLIKYAVVFLSGGIVILIPLVCNLLVSSCLFPAYRPNIVYFSFFGIDRMTMWSELFYTMPVLYTVLFLLLDFLFSGLFATLSYACSLFVHNRLAVLILPYLAILVLHYSRKLMAYRVYKEISPIHFLHASCIANPTVGGIVFVEGLLFALVPLFGIWKVGINGEIY